MWTRLQTRSAFASEEAWCSVWLDFLYMMCKRLVAWYYPIEWRENVVAIARMLSQLWFSAGCIFRTDWVFVYAGFGGFVFRAGASLALASPRKAPLASYTRAASPSATCCYTIITTTDYFLIPLHCTNLLASSTTPTSTSTHSQARADTRNTSPTSHNTANMVLEATMIVYVPLSRQASAERGIHR